MTESERRTWPLAARDARDAALWAVESGDDRDAADIAHEYADGCADVIYNGRALQLYMDSSTVSDWSDDATGYVPPDERTPERIASVCAYLAISAETHETLEKLRDDAHHSDSVLANAARMRERVERGNAWLTLIDNGHVKRQGVAS